LSKEPRADKTGRVTRKIFKIVLGAIAAAYVVGGALAIAGLLGSAREAESLGRAYAVFGSIILIIGLVAGGAVCFARKWGGWLIIAGGLLCMALPVLFFGVFWVEMEKGEVHRRQSEADVNSGKYDFGEQPALFAVARAIVANDQEAIRAAAKAVPDLQASGRDGATLLCWTVTQTWQRPELVQALKTLLALGADPNYTNGHEGSFALGYSVHGPVEGLRAMLDAGGNPNALNSYGWPLVFMHYKLGYYQDQERTRLDLLLDRGADINAIVPDKESEAAGYTLVLYTTHNGKGNALEYDTAQHLLERGADPNRVAPDGMTLAKKLTQRRDEYAAEKRTLPREFVSLLAWAEAHGILGQPQ
jgi:hypothetical protein